MNIVEDGFWPWNALQVLRRLDSDLQNALHDNGLGGNGGRWGVACRRSGVQRQDITGIGLAEPPEPFADPGM